VQWNPVAGRVTVERGASPAVSPAPAPEPALDVVAGSDDTRLELARAYIEIGDGDGARAMLEEVLADGDAAAKREAERLLRTLG
jgi:FimV-like protein